MKRIGFLGAGHMGGAMLRGLAALPERPGLRVYDTAPGRAAMLAAELGVQSAASPSALAGSCDIVVLAVRPGDMSGLLSELRGGRGSPLYLSIAAGRTTAWLEERLPAGARVVRAMPNLGVSVGLGMSAYSPGTLATEDDMDAAERVLSAFGKAVRLPEAQLDAVTALSGSGPAFFAYALQAIAEGGAALGLDPATAAMLAIQTMRGTAAMLEAPGAPSLSGFISAVSTPGGTTAAGIDVLEASDVKPVYAACLAAAARRSAELSAL